MVRLVGMLFLLGVCTLGIFREGRAALLISELDCDTEGTDTQEFVEILNGGTETFDFSSTPVVLVLFNGSADLSYEAVALEGSLAPGDVLLVGSAGITPDQTIPNNRIQNGADAVALYLGTVEEWTDGTPPKLGYLDALVYDTSDDDALGLLGVFDPQGGVQVDENANGRGAEESIQRITLGLGGENFVVGEPTPGASTVVPAPQSAVLLGTALAGLFGLRRQTLH